MISVCMATYNGERFIKEQLDSILAQLSDLDEVIISDDGSSDSTISIIKGYNDRRIKLLHFRRNKVGIEPVHLITTNFENALRHCRGEYIFLSDQDDVWLANKVSIMMEYLLEYDYVVSDCVVVDSKLNLVQQRLFGSPLMERANRQKYKALIGRVVAHGASSAFRREILRRAMPFPKGIQSHDRWLGFVAMFYYRYRAIDKVTVLYRRHSDNASSSSTLKSSNGLMKRVAIRFRYMWELVRI
ncbi:MAG: glycosyltransferase [Rikenellaceae bacterium]